MQVKRWLQHGPYKIEHEGECLCKNNSKGPKCGFCVSGFFNLADSCTRFVVYFKERHSRTLVFTVNIVPFPLVRDRTKNELPPLVPVLGYSCSCGHYINPISVCPLPTVILHVSLGLPRFLSKFFTKSLCRQSLTKKWFSCGKWK